MKKLIFVLIFVGALLPLQTRAEEFACDLQARGDWLWLSLSPSSFEKLQNQDIKAEVVINSKENFDPRLNLQGHVKELGQNHFQINFSLRLRNNEEVAYFFSVMEGPEFFDFQIKIQSEGKEEVHSLSVQNESVILTLAPNPELRSILDSIRESDWAILHYRCEYDQPSRSGISWTLLFKEALIELLENDEKLVIFVEKEFTLQGARITLSISGGDWRGKLTKRFLTQEIFLEEEAPGEWSIELDEPYEVQSKGKKTTTWGAIRR